MMDHNDFKFKKILAGLTADDSCEIVSSTGKIPGPLRSYILRCDLLIIISDDSFGAVSSVDSNSRYTFEYADIQRLAVVRGSTGIEEYHERTPYPEDCWVTVPKYQAAEVWRWAHTQLGLSTSIDWRKIVSMAFHSDKSHTHLNGPHITYYSAKSFIRDYPNYYECSSVEEWKGYIEAYCKEKEEKKPVKDYSEYDGKKVQVRLRNTGSRVYTGVFEQQGTQFRLEKVYEEFSSVPIDLDQISDIQLNPEKKYKGVYCRASAQEVKDLWSWSLAIIGQTSSNIPGGTNVGHILMFTYPSENPVKPIDWILYSIPGNDYFEVDKENFKQAILEQYEDGAFEKYNNKVEKKVYNNKEEKKMETYYSKETLTEVVFEFCVPGSDKKDISVNADTKENKLIVKVPVINDYTHNGLSQSTNKVMREVDLSLSDRYDVSNAEVKVEKGLLTITIRVKDGIIKEIPVG